MEPVTRWNIVPDCRALYWDCELNPADHSDFIEMSGLYTSAITFYYFIYGFVQTPLALK